MSIFKSLPVRNCLHRPVRTAAMTALSALLSFSVLAGSLMISGLKNGLNSLETRLGADIMVVPYEAVTKSALTGLILQGNPGYFYMDKSYVDRLSKVSGIGQMSEQFFLASSTSSCCSYKVQIIGFDPATDFTILPWAQRTYNKKLGYMEVLVGSSLNAFTGDELTFYGSDVSVAAKLDKTGTYLDSAVYANEDTIKTLISAAKEKKIFDFGSVDPEQIVSSVLINVADGYSAEEVLNDINIHVRGVEAVQTQNMVSDVAGKLSGISDIAGALVVVVWLLVLTIMAIAFFVLSNERKKEFAVLRLAGASRKKLITILMGETIPVSVSGSTAGAAFAVLMVSLFSSLIETSLNLPFLIPGTGRLWMMALCAIGVSVAASSASASFSAYRISRMDTALVMRGDNG